MKEYIGADLDVKYKILAILSFNNTALIVLVLNFYIKVLSFFGFKNKIKEFNIIKKSEVHYTVNTEGGVINTPTIFRCLNLSSGLNSRTEFLARSYGLEFFKNVFEKKTPIVIDIGANIGEFSIFCASRNSNVMAIEHDKIAYQMLKLNAKNYQGKINTFNLSISNRSGIDKIYYDTITGGTTIIKPLDTSNYKSFKEDDFTPEKKMVTTTQSLTLDEFIDQNEINFIDLIKCDAEGAEPEIIEGLKNNSSKVGYVAVDTIGERNGEDTTEMVVKLLIERNFQIIRKPENKIGRTVIAKNKNLNYDH
jgi:FkbM family methyltransferase